MVVGTLLTIYLVWFQPNILNFIFLAVYVGLWIVEFRVISQPKTYGTVQDSTGNPLGLAIVRALDTSGHLKATVITGDDGKFIINLRRGTYYFDATRLGYKPSRSDKTRITGLSDLSKIKLILNKH